jgi:phospholipase/lecithinase/hemolysin
MHNLRPRNNLLFLIIVFYINKSQSQNISYDTIVSFGDSSSDTGNVYNLTNKQWPVVPPYYLGRFSNGPVWVEKLGIANLINYAYGSATSDNNIVPGYTAFQTSVPGVRQQIIQYKNVTDPTKINFNRTIYIIWVNGNDYFFNLTLPPTVVVNSIINGIKDLIQFGSTHFLILNQTPLQAYPAAAVYNMNDYLNTISVTHNSNLSYAIQSLRSNYSNIQFQLFDIYSLISDMYTNPSTYGINSTKNCWDTSTGVVNQTCTTPDTYLFIDEYHFTTRIHQLIANNALKALYNSKGVIKSPNLVLFISSFFITLIFFF